MAQATGLSYSESKAFDYAGVYSVLGFKTSIHSNEDGEVFLSTTPGLPVSHALALALPECDLPERTM